MLVGLNADCFPKEETATETTLDELEALLNTAGGECAGKILQNKHTPDPRSLHRRGQGCRRCASWSCPRARTWSFSITTSRPPRSRALEDVLKTHRARPQRPDSRHLCPARQDAPRASLQVELAQYQYYLPRLTVWNEEMGRLGGGTGTRGPGETQLETDKPLHPRAHPQACGESLDEVRQRPRRAAQQTA
ncbi:MAG: hypothetical protein ACLUFI_10470 [Oscillospiraceae bacterium]